MGCNWVATRCVSLMLLIVAKVDVQLGTLEFNGFSRPPDPFQI